LDGGDLLLSHIKIQLVISNSSPIPSGLLTQISISLVKIGDLPGLHFLQVFKSQFLRQRGEPLINTVLQVVGVLDSRLDAEIQVVDFLLL